MRRPGVGVPSPSPALLTALLLLGACGQEPAPAKVPAEEPLGAQKAALCSLASPSTLTLTGMSSYQGELAGSGTWSVTYPSNAVWTEYHVNGVLRASGKRMGTYDDPSKTHRGSWFFSVAGVPCNSLQTVVVRTYPMIVDSAGNESICWDYPQTLTQPVFEQCSVLSAGAYHMVARKQDGTTWGWGYNYYGQLADGTTTNRYTPVQMGISSVTNVGGAGYQSAASKQDGTVWTWGNNDYSLSWGGGPNSRRTTPVQMTGIDNVRTVVPGGGTVFVVKHDGTVWGWGRNSAGQLGDGTTLDRATPVQVVGLGGVVAVSAGTHFAMALKQDGTVWAWGSNTYGQLGDGTTTPRTTPVQVVGLGGVVSISAGGYFASALRQDGTLWTWGYNSSGQLGNGTTTDRWTPGLVGSLSNVIALSAGYEYMAALRQDGTVWTWGNNLYAQLGDGTTTNRSTPARVANLGQGTHLATGYYHTVVRRQDGTLWGWGYNYAGQVGDGTTAMRYWPVQVVGFQM